MVDVVVVRHEEVPVAARGFDEVEENLVRSVRLFVVEGPDVGQAVVEAPPLPDVAAVEGVRDAVSREPVERPGGFREASLGAAPLVEAHPHRGFAPAHARAMAGNVAPGARGGEGPARGRHEGKRRVVARLDREDIVFAAAEDAVGKLVGGLAERGAVCVVGAGVARHVAEEPGGELEGARLLQHVAEAHVGALGG